MCLCHQAVLSDTGQGAVVPCGWEGNRRSGVALVMRHRLQWFIYLRSHGLRKGDEHPAYTARGVWTTLPLRRSSQPATSNAHRRSSFVDYTCDDRHVMHSPRILFATRPSTVTRTSLEKVTHVLLALYIRLYSPVGRSIHSVKRNNKPKNRPTQNLNY